jgi:hypothetical protein
MDRTIPMKRFWICQIAERDQDHERYDSRIDPIEYGLTQNPAHNHYKSVPADKNHPRCWIDVAHIKDDQDLSQVASELSNPSG